MIVFVQVFSKNMGFLKENSVTRYSRFVVLMKIVLPSMAALLLGLILIWPRITEQKDGFKADFSQPKTKQAENLYMVNAKYYSTDKNNQPFSLTADSATETVAGTHVVKLVKPNADIMLNTGAWVAATAKTGFYDKKKDTLDLTGTVSIFHDSGYNLQTENVSIDLKNKTAIGMNPVQASGAFGSISSTGITVLDSGKRIVFTGKAKIILYFGEMD